MNFYGCTNHCCGDRIPRWARGHNFTTEDTEGVQRAQRRLATILISRAA
jgi:hypothetical protein